MIAAPDVRFKFTSELPLKYGANAAAEFDDPNWPRFIRITDITSTGGLRDETFRSLPPEIASGFELEVGDILLARSGATVGKAFIYDASWGAACFAGYLIRSRTSERYEPKFLYWYLQSAPYWSEIQSNLIQATIQNFSADKYANLHVPSPPLETQKQIASFLDGKTAQIDGLIAKKEVLLQQLAERRQAILSQAVTKGLDSTVPMKNSGIEWIGEIPAHWQVKPFKRAVFYQEGPGIMAADFRDEGVPLLRVASVGERWATLEGVNYLDPELVSKKWAHFATREGDLLISASATSGIVSEIGSETVGCIPYTGIIRLNPVPMVSTSPFIRHFVVSRQFVAQIDQLKAGSTIQHFGPYHLGLMAMPVPPIEEQKEITAWLDGALAAASTAEQRVTKSVELLSEYRTALITAAVNGQIEGLR
ncbi:restriction endonuclease subunit S [Humitalea sp. 24SJ18S-53]|uniref:restriction endonuclease subunit S n=1 Tax=Humitalea sp. 24SJ18S-53 TaxID=3422307 RepID=UPI003D67AA4E